MKRLLSLAMLLATVSMLTVPALAQDAASSGKPMESLMGTIALSLALASILFLLAVAIFRTVKRRKRK